MKRSQQINFRRMRSVNQKLPLIKCTNTLLGGLISICLIMIIVVIHDPPLFDSSLPIPPSSKVSTKLVQIPHKDQKEKYLRRNMAIEIRDLKAPKPDEDKFDDFLPRKVVHVINTRFMQWQGNLTSLGQARLEIFKSFCLPSIAHQTNSNFLWIIRTDPNLDESLKTQMIELLAPYPNFLLVGTNYNPEYFREVNDVTNSSALFSGSMELARRYLEISKNVHVLETRLDSDDGLSSTLVEDIQKSAEAVYLEINDREQGEKSWTVWCLHKTLEWHMKYNLELSSGIIIPHVSEICLTPGLTVAFPPDVTRSQLPTMKHTKLHKVLQKCSNEFDTGCLRQVQSETLLGSIRVRTPTSSGMMNVLSIPKTIRAKWEKYQDKIWKDLPQVFSINKQAANILNKYLSENLKLIALDNLKGQCTKGHSCKQGSKDKLNIIIKNIPEEINNEDEKKRSR